MCWSDEVIFEVVEDGGVYYVTRGPNEEHLDKNLKPTFNRGVVAAFAPSIWRQERIKSDFHVNRV